MIGRVAVTTVSRSTEMQAVDALLSSAKTGPSALVLAGEPGIGKTTLWLAGVARARERGFRVLSARADQAESVLSFAMVADLLDGVEANVLDGLPALHRVAVDRVLFGAGTDGPPTDQHVTAAAIAAILTALVVERPVLLAIDDVQWLDASSRAVLALVAKRLRGGIGILLTGRANGAQSDPAAWLELETPDAVRRVRVGPLSLAALHTMIVDRLGRTLPRPTMVRIVQVSGGNPLYALELARAVDGRSTNEDSVLPGTLAELARLRTGHFDGEVGDILLAACCVADATVDLLAHATGVSAERVVELLEVPERDDIVRFDGDRVHFAHPLLARGIYTQAGPARRRRMHRALASVDAQPESRARHMALGAATAEPETLAALDDAADSAVARGAAAVAADLYELAIGLGGDTHTRRLRAAEQHVRAGDFHQARAVLAPAIDHLGPGPSRAAAHVLLGTIRIAEHDYVGAAPLLAAAVGDAADDLPLLVRAHLSLSRVRTMMGEHREARHHAELALVTAETVGAPTLMSQALAVHSVLACAHGLGRDEAALKRARELEVVDSHVAAPFDASAAEAVTMGWTGRLDEALVGLVAARRRYLEIGSEADVMYLSGHLSMVYVWLGRYSAAADVAEDLIRRGEMLDSGYPVVVARGLRALASAYLGHERTARSDATAAITGAEQCGSPFLAAWPLTTLGFLEASLGNHAEALKVLRPLLAQFEIAPGTEIFSATYLPDAIEAMVALGRLDDAAPLIEALEVDGARLDRPWMLAVGARGRSLWLAARGDLVGAEEMVRRALPQHDRLPMPFERARTQLLLGQLLRRRRRRHLAVTTLREALTTFEDLGAPLWASRVAAELARTDAPRTAAMELTSAELRVARLTASGMSNKDIASALFISPKTVEHNLSRVYRKLDVRTRAELASRADEFGDD